MKSKMIRAALTVMTLLFCALPVFAQGGATGGGISNQAYAYIAGGIGFAIAAGLAALGQSRVASSACEGIARNPGAGARIQTAMILGLAFIETLVIFTLVIVFVRVTPGT
jgi:F-type H+-transporting ATPase subunit c